MGCSGAAAAAEAEGLEEAAKERLWLEQQETEGPLKGLEDGDSERTDVGAAKMKTPVLVLPIALASHGMERGEQER